jgi:hypothetical protein
MGVRTPTQRHDEYVRRRAKHAEECKKYYVENKTVIQEWYRVYHRQKKYNLSEEAFNERVNEQNGLCAICGLPPLHNFHVDHDHECCEGTCSCGRCLRSLLCERCNPGLGNFNDDPDLLEKAAAYLRNWKKNIWQ